MMSHKQRLETAWAFLEPDRVPIEVAISEHAKRHPRAKQVLRLIAEVADNLVGVPAMDYGFFGIPLKRRERMLIEERPGVYQKYKTTLETEAGVFTAITYHPADDVDYHWEKRYVATLDEFKRLAETPRQPLIYDKTKWHKTVTQIGEGDLPITNLPHPLGDLVRNAATEEVYCWFVAERETMHRFLTVTNKQIAAGVEDMLRNGIGPYFCVTAHEMLLPPWMGHSLFDEFVFPYDKGVNDVIHRYGGKLRAHCHGHCMDFLEKMADMGLDAIEPLEHPPAGNVDLAEAKRRVGHRMMLCGNVASENFFALTPDEVRQQVRDAIKSAARGGGFALRTSGGNAGTCTQVSDDIMARILGNVEAYILAGLEFGTYPIRL